MDFRENKTGRGGISLLLAAVLLNLFLSGCARQYWTERLEEEEASEISRIVHLMQEETRNCPDSLDATALIFWKSPLEESAIEGYLQLLSPSFFKFVINNPLGQPLYAISSNGEMFQSLHIAQQKHIRGNIRSLALRNEIPPALVSGNWFAYLTGRLPEQTVEIGEINRDTTNKTVWIHLPNSVFSGEAEKVYVHLAPAEREILGYLLLDQKDATLAEISYKDEKGKNILCLPRKTIEVTNLPWGAELRIELREINTDTQFQRDDFSLPVPPGYATQLQP